MPPQGSTYQCAVLNALGLAVSCHPSSDWLWFRQSSSSWFGAGLERAATSFCCISKALICRPSRAAHSIACWGVDRRQLACFANTGPTESKQGAATKSLNASPAP